MLLSKRFLILGLVACAILYLASVRARAIRPAHPQVAVAASGSFQANGWYPGEPFADAVGVRAWGSWSGNDDNVGTLTIGPFPAPRVLRFGLGGYATRPGNLLQVELASGGAAPIAIPAGDVGELWRVVDFELPAAWRGQPIKLVASDDAKGLGGWLAVTEPIRGGRSDGNNALLETLAAWAINGAWLGALLLASVRALASRTSLPPWWVPLGAGALVAMAAYAAFWLYLINPLPGRVFSWGLLVAAITWLWRTRHEVYPAIGDDLTTVLKLMAAVGAFYLALLHLFPTTHNFYTLAANRYREALPSDNELSHVLAERLFTGQAVRHTGEEWLSSDRPPLQSGWELLAWPAAKLLQLDRRTASGTAAVWFQLLWVAAAYGLLRSLRLNRPRAAAWVAALALSGFFVQNTTFTWPKLAAGAFACGAFALLVLEPPADAARERLGWVGLFAALGWLTHGGVAFSYLALLPWIVARIGRGRWRAWLPAAAAFLLLTLPWLAYQKFYDPPGNRLIKWHLAGRDAIDPRGAWQTIRDSYAQAGWRGALSNKVANFHGQVFGNWRFLADFSRQTRTDRRNQEFFQTGRALTWWPVLALIALVLVRGAPRPAADDLARLGAWLGLTIVVWCLLMFSPYSAAVHQGSYACMIGLFVWCSVMLERAGRGWLPLIVALQAVTLGTTWAVSNNAIDGPPAGLPIVIVTAALLGWFLVSALGSERDLTDPVDQPDAALPGGWSRFTSAMSAWYRQPRLTLWVLLGIAAALFLRRPDALHTPQIWAEDGSIFLNHQDMFGPQAILWPYMGYLHLLPRLIAWLAPHLLDPAWWPALYNGAAFAIWVAVLARLFSPRLDLPGKPWLALAFVFAPHSGEIFFNITNLQWITAFALIQQAVIAPPANVRERAGDLVILLVISLTGPFAIALAPLFVWRWWRARTRDNLLALLVVGAGAAIQASFVLRFGPKFDYQSAPVHLWPGFVVVAHRLVAWPLLGRDVALGLSPALAGLLGAIALAAIFGWALRAHTRRRLRLELIAALGLVLLAGLYRARPDTWSGPGFDFADRYFYIPRVLLLWLVVTEFDAAPRAIANTARVFFLCVAVANIWNYTPPAPTDYHWAGHVDPIRRAIPADIPTLPEGWTLEYRGGTKPR